MLAQAALAQAEQVEAERRAELETPAKAHKAKTIVEAEAERTRLEAEGEAAAVFARLEAEARGQYEILARKGEGLRTIIDACGGAQPAFQLLMLEHLDNLAEASAMAISNIKFDKVIVWEGGRTERSNVNVQFSAGHVPHAAADDAGNERHRRCGDA